MDIFSKKNFSILIETQSMIEKISILIVTRNRVKMLANCLNSLTFQTRKPDEVIIVDSSFDDNTQKVVISFKKKLPIIYSHEKKIGIPFAQNKAIWAASGSILVTIDDDCEADRFWVERIEDAHKKYPKAWAVQGRSTSIPKERMYSVLSEFSRLLYVRNSAKNILPLDQFFTKYFSEEIEVLMCDTKNFSIKSSYLKEYNLSFDECSIRGADTDFGRKIVSKNGLIMYCPKVHVSHWERSSLTEFLKQRWYIGRTAARMKNKWKGSFMTLSLSWPEKPLAFFMFYKVFYFNQWHRFPIIFVLLSLDKLNRISGYFYEKGLLSLAKR